MKQTIVLKEYPKLTNAIKELFGSDIIEKAYISILQYPESEFECDEEKEFDEAFNKIEFMENGIHCNTTSIVIEFYGGVRITFWASEWGGFYNEWQQVDL